jgi:hypothetical protein
MRVIAVICEYETRKKILEHLGLWNIRSHSPPPPSQYPPAIGWRRHAGCGVLLPWLHSLL